MAISRPKKLVEISTFFFLTPFFKEFPRCTDSQLLAMIDDVTFDKSWTIKT